MCSVHIDVHEHGDARPLDQRAHSLSLGSRVRHGNSSLVRAMARVVRHEEIFDLRDERGRDSGVK